MFSSTKSLTGNASTDPTSVTSAPRASARSSFQKKPVNALLTMSVVTGLVAVVGLPAYAASTVDQAPVSYAADAATAQYLAVSAKVTAPVAARDGFTATTQAEIDAAAQAALAALYIYSGPRDASDDYPWPYGGDGLSPLNYYYGECVDFVAWRLNRDAGSTSAPFRWVWSNLTPSGGDASQWQYAWQSHGWPVSSVPVVGSVAVTDWNHVAYVKSVNGDGTVSIEEYNYGAYHRYGQRTIAASSVIAFLYPPG